MCGLRVVLEGVSGTVRANGAAGQGGGVDGKDGYLDLHDVPVRDRRGGGAQTKLLLAGGLREIWILVLELGGGVEYANGGSSNRRGDWREEGQAGKGPPTLNIVVAALPPLSQLRGRQWLWLGEEAGRRPPWPMVGAAPSRCLRLARRRG